MQDQIRFIYYEYVIAICIIGAVKKKKLLLLILLVILQGSDNSASVKAGYEVTVNW